MNRVVTSLAHRKLRTRVRFGELITHAVGFHDACDEPDYVAQFEIPNEHVVGVYENDPGVDPAIVAVTDRGLRFPGSSQPQIDFADIEETSPPPSKTEGPREMTIVLRDGRVRVLPVTRRYGPSAKYQDVYSFNMFLRAIVRHQALGRRSQAESDQTE